MKKKKNKITEWKMRASWYIILFSNRQTKSIKLFNAAGAALRSFLIMIYNYNQIRENEFFRIYTGIEKRAKEKKA